MSRLNQIKIYFYPGVVKAIAAIISFFLTLVISLYLNKADAGIFFLLLSIVTVLSFVLTFGREYLLLRKVALLNTSLSLKENFYYIFSQIKHFIFLGSLFSILFFIFTFFSLEIFSGELNEYLRIFIFSVPALSGIVLVSFGIQGQQKISLSIIFSRILCPLILILAIVIGTLDTLSELSLYFVLISWAVFLASLVAYSINHSKTNNKKLVNNEKNANSSIIFLFFIGVTQQIFIWQGTILTSFFFQSSDIAAISVAQRVALLISFILITVNAVNAPKFARLYEERRFKEIQNMAFFSTLICCFCGLIVSIPMFVYAENILSLFGEAYSGEKTSLRILIIGQIYNCFAGPVGILLIMTKQFKESALSSIFALFLSFVFAYVLNGFMGLLSIPTAIITSLFIKNSLDIIFIKRNLGFFVFKPA